MQGKYPKRPVITSGDQAQQEAFYQTTDPDAPLEAHQIAVGYIQHPDSGLWQVWISTNGLDFTQLAAFRESQKAADAIAILQKEGKNLSNPVLMTGLLTFLEQQSDGQVQPLPDDLVRKLVRDILHYVL